MEHNSDADIDLKEDNRREDRFGRRAGEKMIHRLVELGIALSSEKDHDRLMEMILLEAKNIYNADGGTLYLVTDDETGLSFQIMRNDTLNISMGGTTGKKIPFPPVPLYRPDSSKNMNNVASAVYHQAVASNIVDAYEAQEYDFSGTKKFDETTGYRSKSFLTVPMINTQREVIGVLQLINARDQTSNTIAFETSLQPMIEALTSQAAVALENQMLIQQQRALWNSLIEMIAARSMTSHPIPVVIVSVFQRSPNCWPKPPANPKKGSSRVSTWTRTNGMNCISRPGCTIAGRSRRRNMSSIRRPSWRRSITAFMRFAPDLR